MFADCTKLSAQEVAIIVSAVMEHAPDSYFKLETVQDGPDGATPGEELLVRILVDQHGDGDVTTLADDTEVVHCASKDGRRIDIILGPPRDRGTQCASLVIQKPD